jgi:predicted ATPase
VIDSYRYEEVDVSHPLTKTLGAMSRCIKPPTTVLLGILSANHVATVISALTRKDEPDCLELAKIVTSKTDGNPLFVLSYLELLQDRHLLYRSTATFQWEWNTEKIRVGTKLSDNVAGIAVAKLERLPFETIRLLKVAAFLSSTFEAVVVVLVMRKIEQFLIQESAPLKPETEEFWRTHLAFAVEEGLIIQHTSSRYSWTHDRIAAAAMSLVPDHDLKALRFHVGTALHPASPNRMEWMVFVSADHLNQVKDLVWSNVEKHKLALLNLEAANKAIERSALCPAMKHLRHGLDVMPPTNPWGLHYELTLKLHNLLAEMEYCVGHHDTSRKLIDAVLANAKNLSDSLFYYSTVIGSLSAKKAR